MLGTSALSQLRIRVGGFSRIADDVGNKEVPYEQEVYRSADGSGTGRVGDRHQEVEGDEPESAACPDLAQGGRGGPELDRPSDRRGIRVPNTDGGERSSASRRARLQRGSGRR